MERYLGAEHISTLYGRARLGQLLVYRRCWSEAEDVLRDVIQKCERIPTARNSEHPDRLVAEFYLLHCYRLQNRLQMQQRFALIILNGLTSIGGENHPFMTHVMQTQEALRDPEKMTGSLSTTWMVI